MLRTLLVSLALVAPAVTPATAQLIDVPYDPNGERAHVSGPYAQFSPHILKLSARTAAAVSI